MYTGAIDLHLHLDGAMADAFASQYLKKLHMDIPDHLSAQMCVGDECASLMDYLRCFDIPKMILQYAEILEECAYDLVCRLAHQGILYAEIRFAPANHCLKGLSQTEAVESVWRGVQRAILENQNIRIGLILCFLVGDDENHLETLKTAAKLYGNGVVGVDMAGAEGSTPLAMYRTLFENVRASGIPFTIHAGECGSYENIELAIEYGAKRIGHGVAAIKSESCQKMIMDRGIVLECCFTSNLQTKAVIKPEDHPIYSFYKNGMKVTINTDNMTVSNTDIRNEHLQLKKYFSFSDSDFLQMDSYAVDAAFLPASEKDKLRLKLKNQKEPD